MSATAISPLWAEPIFVKQSFETEDEFAAFQCMKHLPKRARNMQDVARYCSLSYDQVLSLAERHHWRARLAAYDGHQAQDAGILLRRQKDDAQVQHMRLLEKSAEVLHGELDALIERQRHLRAQGASQVSLLKPSEMSRLLERMIKLDRLIMGEVTERAGEEFDLSRFTTQELEQWYELMRKAKVE